MEIMEIIGFLGFCFFACTCAACAVVFAVFIHSALNDPEEWEMRKKAGKIAGVRRGEKLRGGK